MLEALEYVARHPWLNITAIVIVSAVLRAVVVHLLWKDKRYHD